MTTDQAVNRQADHENLIQELADAVYEFLMYADKSDFPEDVVGRLENVLAKVQS